MVSANTLNTVLRFLETNTDSIHPCIVTTRMTKPVMSRVMELRWEVNSNLLFPGDHEIHLVIEGTDDTLEWRFHGDSGYTLASLGFVIDKAWEQCEAEMLADA